MNEATATAPAAAPPVQAAPNLTPLTESETSILKVLQKEVDQAKNNISTFVGHALAIRGLDVNEWGVSLADFKTIIKKEPAPPPSK